MNMVAGLADPLRVVLGLEDRPHLHADVRTDHRLEPAGVEHSTFGDLESTALAVLERRPLRKGPRPDIIVESERVMEKLDAASIHVLGEQEILEVPSAGPQDVFRSLTLLPGIISTSDVSSKFYVRGGAGDQNLILLDGMRIYNPFHAFGVYSVFDPDIINSAEVCTGAFPAGYGNRLSSVVNLTTKQGNSSRLAGRAEANFLSGKLMLEGPIKGANCCHL